MAITYGALRNAFYGLAARYARGGNMRYVMFGEHGFQIPHGATSEEARKAAEDYIAQNPGLSADDIADIRQMASSYMPSTGRDSTATGTGVQPSTGSGVQPSTGTWVRPAQISPGTILGVNPPNFIANSFIGGTPAFIYKPQVTPVETLYDNLSDALRDGDMEKAREIRDKIRSHPDFGSYLAGKEAKARYERDIDKDTKAGMQAGVKKYLDDLQAELDEKDKAWRQAQGDEAKKWRESDEFKNAFAIDLDDYKQIAEENLNEEPLYSTYDDMYRNASRKDLREYVRSGEYAGPNGQQIVPYVSSRRGRREVARSIKKDWNKNGVDDKYRNAQPVIDAINQMGSVQRASAREDARAKGKAKREAIRNIRNGTVQVQRNGGAMMRTFIGAMRRGGRL